MTGLPRCQPPPPSPWISAVVEWVSHYCHGEISETAREKRNKGLTQLVSLAANLCLLLLKLAPSWEWVAITVMSLVRALIGGVQLP